MQLTALNKSNTCMTVLQMSAQIKYGINKVQLKMLQITSRRAEQALTIHCKNLAFVDEQLTFRGFKSGTTLRARSLKNGCSVSTSILSFLHRDILAIIMIALLLRRHSCNYYNSVACIDFFPSQEATSLPASSRFNFHTKRPQQLPVTDISLWLGSDSSEALAVELGPVCFSR